MDYEVGAGAGRAMRKRALIAALMMTAATLAGVVAIGRTAVAQSAAQVSFDVPAGPLGRALTTFGRQAGLQVTYLSATTAGKTSSGLSGPATREQALTRILQGTGLVYRFTNATTVAISSASSESNAAAVGGATMLSTIDVQGETAWGPVDGYVATRSATASKTDAAIIETPQSISVVTRDEMDAQAATTVSESLRFTAGIMTGQAGLQSRRFDPVFLRGFGGFSAAANYASYLDGLKWHFPGRTAVQIDPWMLERVEVFKGPSSVLYGQATPGGFVNMVSKRPSAKEAGEAFIRAGTYGYLEGGFDLTGPIANDPRFLYRVVGLGRMADSQIDYQSEQRMLIAPSFTYAPSIDTSFTVQAIYQRDPKAIDSGFLPVVGTVLPSGYGQLPKSRFQGDPNWNLYDRTEKAIGYQFQHSFNDVITVRQNFRYGKLENDFRGVDFATLQADNRTLNRSIVHFLHDVDSISLDNQLQAKFDTGPLRHTMLFGVDYQYMDAKWRYGTGAGPTIDIYAPVYFQNITAPALVNNRQDRLNQGGIYAQDQIEFGNWRLWLSGRRDHAKTDYTVFNTTANRYTAAVSTDDTAYTWRTGLVYLFENGLAPYVSYSTSFEPQAGADVSGNPFKPTTGRQLEVGIKYQPQGWNSFITLSAFDLRKENVLSVDPVNPLYSIQNGEVLSRGFELEGKANLTQGLDLVATYTYTDIKFSKSNNTVVLIDGSGEVGLEGKIPVAVPRHMASLWANYRFTEGQLAGFSLGGGVRYIGETYGTDSNVWNLTGFVTTPSKVPGFTLVDLAVKYDLGYASRSLKGFTAAVNARNLFDKTYVAACNGYGSCTYGEGRTVLGTLSYKW